MSSSIARLYQAERISLVASFTRANSLSVSEMEGFFSEKIIMKLYSTRVKRPHAWIHALKLRLPTLSFRQWYTVKKGFWFFEISQLMKSLIEVTTWRGLEFQFVFTATNSRSFLAPLEGKVVVLHILVRGKRQGWDENITSHADFLQKQKQ